MVIKAFARAPGATLAPFLYAQMLWTVAAGWLWFGDWPVWSTWAGIGQPDREVGLYAPRSSPIS